MAAQWASQERQGWISAFGTRITHTIDAAGSKVEKKSLDPADYQWKLIQLLQDLLESKTDPQSTAQLLAPLILSYSNIETAWHNLWGCLFSAIDYFSGEADLKKMGGLLASLATLPDAGDGNQVTGQPGGNNHARDDMHLAGLPHFGLNLRERMNGPEAYLFAGESPETAKLRWRNINTFTALFTHEYRNTVPALSYHLNFALWTLADALEHPPASQKGGNITLHLPAATQWILIAAEDVENAISQNQRATAGPLWQATGGSDQFSNHRWLFWQRRFGEFGASDRLESETKSAAKKAAERMAALTSK